MPRTFYRIVKTDPPRRRDFASNQAKRGAPPPNLPLPLWRLWDGLSVHDTEAQAQRQARTSPWLGRYIAEIRIPEDEGAGLRWERTIPMNQGHYTMWGEPDALLDVVARVLPIEEMDDDDRDL